MDRTPVDSSTIADVGYDEASMTLEVGFRNGTVYQYFDVPQSLHQELMAANSKGAFLSSQIKNNFRYIKS